MSQTLEAKAEHSHFRLDRWGIGISGLCLLHCLALPLAFIFTPFVETWANWHLPIHVGIFLLVLPIAYTSLKQGFHHHHRWAPPVLGILGCSLILLSIILDFTLSIHIHSAHSGWSSSLLLSIGGGAFLVTAHSLNLWACSRVKKSCCPSH